MGAKKRRTVEERAREVREVIGEARGLGGMVGHSVEWAMLALLVEELREVRRILRERGARRKPS